MNNNTLPARFRTRAARIASGVSLLAASGYAAAQSGPGDQLAAGLSSGPSQAGTVIGAVIAIMVVIGLFLMIRKAFTR